MDINYVSNLLNPELDDYLQSKPRNNSALPLQEICICCIIKNYYFFISHANTHQTNPCERLPNSIIQKIFLVLAEKQKCKRKAIPQRRHSKEFIKLFLNSNIKRFPFRDLCFLSVSDADNIFDHLVENCPKVEIIEKPTFRILRSRNCFQPPLLQPRHLCKWKNLSVAQFGDFPLNDSVLHAVQENLKFLEVFEFTLSKNGDISLEGLNCLKKCTRIRHIQANAYQNHSESLRFVVAIPGLPPNLQKFGSNLLTCDDTSNYCVVEEIFSKFKSTRKLTLLKLTLTDAPEGLNWPENFNVDCLELIGAPQKQFSSFVCTIPKPIEKIVFDSITPNEIHTILSKFVSNLIHLEILSKKGSLRRYINEKLNLYKIFSSAPNLQKFVFLAPFHLEGQELNCGLTPRHFKSISSFEIIFLSGDGTQNLMKNIIKLAYIGSNYMTKLNIYTDCDVAAALEVLQESPDSLVAVNELRAHHYILNTQLIKVIVILVERSAHFKTISLICSNERNLKPLRKMYPGFFLYLQRAKIAYNVILDDQ